MKRVLLLLVLLALFTAGYGFWTDVYAYCFVPPSTYIGISAPIYINNVYTGFSTPHRFEPNTTYYGTYTVQLAGYGPWGPTSVTVAPTSGNRAIIFTTDCPITVPIVLSSFTATISADNFVNLTWITQSETGVRGYYILRNTTDELTTAITVSGLIPATNSSQTSTYVFKDTELYEEGTYYYWLQNSDLDGHDYYYGPSTILYATPGEETPEPPQATKLGPVFPNPFNPNTVIPFTLRHSNSVTLRIYNTRGQEVKNLDLGQLPAGYHQVGWDGRDASGQALPSGIYHIRMQAGEGRYQVKAVLMK